MLDRQAAPLLPEPDGAPEDMDIIIAIGTEPLEEIVEDALPPFDANLAEELDEDEASLLASALMGEVASDIESRREWLECFADGLELLGLRIEERTEPWDGACGIHHPILTEALVKFQSETIMSTFPAQGPVKTVVVGKESSEKLEAAARVKEDMNYRLTEQMHEYRPEHERLLWGLGLSGNGFKKVYYDPNLGRQVAMYIPAEDLVVPYGASNLENAERITHVMRKTPNEMARLMRLGFYISADLGDPEASSIDDLETKIQAHMGLTAEHDNRHKIYEIHAVLDLAEYGLEDPYNPYEGEGPTVALPYVVTVDCGTNTVLAVRRNWAEEDDLCKPRLHFVHYAYIPGFGFYAFGLVHLLGGFAKGSTAILRQLVDAGTLANLPAGFKSNNLRVRGDQGPLQPGEYRDVDVGSGTIREALHTLEFKGPNPTLFQLLTHLEDQGRRFASIADMKVSDMSAEAPVGTTLALLERQLKVMTAVQARIHHALRQEFRILKMIIRDHMPETYDYEPAEGDPSIKRDDYDIVDIFPVSDPNAATLSQKVVQYQAVIQMAQGAPEIYNKVELHRQMLDILGIKDADKLVPTEDDLKPMDPISENMALLNNKPVKAFLYQDHEAHIEAHIAAIQDPKIAELVGQNPNATAIMAAAAAHVTEHIAFAYRQKVEEELGVPLPDPEQALPESVEVELSRLVAQAAQRVLGKHRAEAQQERNEQLNDDPVVQMQREELAIKREKLELEKREQEMKEKKAMVDAAAQADKLALDEKRLMKDAAKDADQMDLQAKEQQDRSQRETARTLHQIRADNERLEIEDIRAGLDAMNRVAGAQQGPQTPPVPEGEGQ